MIHLVDFYIDLKCKRLIIHLLDFKENKKIKRFNPWLSKISDRLLINDR